MFLDSMRSWPTKQAFLTSCDFMQFSKVLLPLICSFLLACDGFKFENSVSPSPQPTSSGSSKTKDHIDPSKPSDAQKQDPPKKADPSQESTSSNEPTNAKSSHATKGQEQHSQGIGKPAVAEDDKNQGSKIDEINKLFRKVTQILVDDFEPLELGSIRISPKTIDITTALAQKKSENGDLNSALPSFYLESPDFLDSRELTPEELKLLNTSGSLQTYINFGCKPDQIPSEMVNGLKEVKGLLDSKENFMILRAQKIFSCGKIEIKKPRVLIIANEIILNKSYIFSRSEKGLIAVSTRRLHLKGQNSFLSINAHTQQIGHGIPLIISIETEIKGTGSLGIQQISDIQDFQDNKKSLAIGE